MQVLHFLQGVKFDSLHIEKLLETDSGIEIRICMPRAEEMRKHQAPGAIKVRVLQGRIWFEVGGEKHTLETGDCISLDANVAHSLGGLEDSVLNLSLSKIDSVQRVLDVASK
ncbi:cupin domain-containing protein [Helicobacter suis]|uniref:cupin domain-containing protein n=1 Tax=Helicobacter suis TaxID=104628 RepID=UPI0013D22826|nr:cupin domain-containing protein [Helicobacter suis]